MKQYSFILLLISLNWVLFSTVNCSENTRSHPLTNNFLRLPDQSVYWQGWIKYFHYNNQTSLHRPKSFFQNNEYFHQRIPKKLRDKKDAHGLIRVPSKHDFFLVFNNDSLTFYTTRFHIMQKNFDSLKINHINLVPEDKPLKGGVRDLGNFDEGKCFEIKATIPRVYRSNFSPIRNFRGIGQTWVLCTSTDRQKATLMSILLKKKLKTQRAHGAVLTSAEIKQRKKGVRINLGFGNRKNGRGKPKDGYWVLLQDWTSCTLKCGGGKSYQQWMCVPPVNGGKPCKGKAIKVRNCNMQKCPHVGNVLKMHMVNRKKAQAQAAKPPVLKIAPFSTRPQRLSKCILKENDAFITSFNPASKEVTRQPIRLVMNNQTVSLYSDDDYTNKIYTFNLDVSSIERSDFCCVRIRDTYKAYKLCGFTSNCGTRLNNQWAEGWLKDFNLFKYDCRTKRQVSSANPLGKNSENIGEMFDEELGKKSTFSVTTNELQRQAEKFQNDFKNKIQKKIIGLKEKKILERVQHAEMKKARSRVVATQNVGLEALVKENQLESLIQNEEKERENRVMSTILKKIRKEQKKRKCLKKTLKRRELDTQILMQKREAEKEVSEVKQEVQMEIDLKRKQMKRTIAQMRKKARRRQAALETQLQRIRAKMAQDLLQANRDGDMGLCKKGKLSPAARNNYCDNNFTDDYVKNTDCKDSQGFCYMCCEHEYGNNFIDKRDVCYDMCDGKKAPLKKTAKKKKKSMSSSSSGSSSKLKKLANKKLGGWVWMKNHPQKKKRTQ